jgi:mycobactin peptide synthetase MbtE
VLSDQERAGTPGRDESTEFAMLSGPIPGYPLGQAVHQAFMQTAERYREKPALRGGDRTIAYGMLASAAHRVAADLAQAGVSPGDVVPVVLRRTLELPAVLLGVLMCGAAYAMLDVEWPQQQQRELTAAVGAKLVVASGALDGIATWTPPADLFDVAVPPGAVPAVDGDAACCVFFTSGSTGVPKPVLSPHRATTRLFESGAFHGSFGPSTAMPQWAPLPWDGLTLELWSMLLTGGTSVLSAEPMPTNDSLRRMVAGGVDSMWLTSSLFNLFVDEDLEAFVGLRQVLTGGERLSVGHVRRFITRHPGIRLVNGYGPAESCVFTTTHSIGPADCDNFDGIPLGRAVAGTSVYILAEDRLCAADQNGEICIAGDGLALEYIGDPELTERRFVHLPVRGVNLRLYRTGDYGRIGRDGLLHFVGRVDRQVKIRGFRVELDDIESRLRAVPGVAEAVVLPDLDDAGACIGMTGFYVPARDADLRSQVVRQGLSANAPRQYVPDRLVKVPRIPVGKNGKVDHAALRAMVSSRPPLPVEAIATPGAVDDPVLADMIALVTDVAGMPVSAETTLGDGGITSLQALRLCIRLNEYFRASLGPQDVLEAKSVRELAGLVREFECQGPRSATADSVTDQPQADTQIGFLVEFETRPHSKAAHCLISWLLRGSFEPAVFRQAMSDVQDRHGALRTRYDFDVEPMLVAGPPRPVEFLDLGRFADADEAWRAALPDLLRPLQIDAGEVWRGNVAQTAKGEYLVALVIHHIALDGWSESILARDLSSAYAVRLAGRAPEVRGPSFAAAVADRVAEATRAAQNHAARDYWAKLLANIPEDPIRGLPVNDPSTVAVRNRQLSPMQTNAAYQLAERLGVTRFPVVVAAYSAAYQEILGEEDFVIGVPVSVRRHASQAESITCLVDTVCLRPRPAPGIPISDVALRAHEQMALARGKYALAFLDVVRSARLPRRHGRNPIFRSMFVLQDNDAPRLRLGTADVRLRRIAVPEPMSELLVEVWPGESGGRVDATFYTDSVSPDVVSSLLDAFGRNLARAADEA